jgi:hypothetical protein
MSKKFSLRALALRRPGPVLMCRKCLGRMENGGKLKRRLKASLKHGAGEKKKRARLVFTTCFGICPKNAVVTGSAATFARGEFILIQDCSEETIEQAAAALS